MRIDDDSFYKSSVSKTYKEYIRKSREAEKKREKKIFFTIDFFLFLSIFLTLIILFIVIFTRDGTDCSGVIGLFIIADAISFITAAIIYVLFGMDY